MTAGPLLIDAILGNAGEEPWHSRLHDISHHGTVEHLNVEPADLKRRRFRSATDHGTDCAVQLARDAELHDGAVLWADERRAVVLRVGRQDWMRLKPAGAAEALELGYHAGNLHWRVRFADGDLLVAADGPREPYLQRIRDMLDGGRVALLG